MIPLAVPNLSGKEREYLNECIDSTFVSSVGPFVERMAKEVAKASGASYSSVLSSGTCAIHLALKAVGVKPGDLVICPSYTFVASANAISHCGAKPWLFDCDLETWTLDVELLARELQSQTERRGTDCIHKDSGKRVGAILPVYTMGHPARMDEVMSLASEFSLPVVADAAAALGATYKGKAIGELADISTYSFNGNKIVTSGGGGGLSTASEELMKKVEHMATTGRVGQEYIHDVIAYNFRMTNVEAAVGCAQMEQLETFVAKKKAIAGFYEEAFCSLPGVETFPKVDWAEGSFWLSGIVLNASFPSVKEICAKMNAQGVGLRTFWQPMHLQPIYKDCLKTSMENCESFWPHVLTLPCSTQITEEELRKVVDLLLPLLKGDA